MANDLQDLGSLERFTFRPNWIDKNVVELETSKEMVAFATTITDIFTYSDFYKNILNLSFILENKEEEYELTDFFNERKGRLERFWIQGYKEEFIFSRTITTGDTKIYVEDNGFDLVYQGHERIYIELIGGDIITRKITGISNAGTELELTVSAMDRGIAADDVGVFGRMYLVRFNKDFLEMKFKTTKISLCKLELAEVVKDYDI